MKRFNSSNNLPDPHDVNTFLKSKLQWTLRNTGKHQALLRWYEQLIRLRKRNPALKNFNKHDVEVRVIENRGLLLQRQDNARTSHILAVFNFSDSALRATLPEFIKWEKLLDSNDRELQQEPVSQQDSEAAGVVVAPFGVCVFGNLP